MSVSRYGVAEHVQEQCGVARVLPVSPGVRLNAHGGSVAAGVPVTARSVNRPTGPRLRHDARSRLSCKPSSEGVRPPDWQFDAAECFDVETSSAQATTDRQSQLCVVAPSASWKIDVNSAATSHTASPRHRSQFSTPQAPIEALLVCEFADPTHSVRPRRPKSTRGSRSGARLASALARDSLGLADAHENASG